MSLHKNKLKLTLLVQYLHGHIVSPTSQRKVFFISKAHVLYHYVLLALQFIFQ